MAVQTRIVESGIYTQVAYDHIVDPHTSPSVTVGLDIIAPHEKIHSFHISHDLISEAISV